MTIHYSSNWMGPVSIDWFRDRGLVRHVKKTLTEESIVVQLGKKQAGDVMEYDEITTHVACGRIDIYGLDETEYYCGRSEYSLPPMKVKSWNIFSDWLDDFETEELWEFDEIIAEFETQCNTTIEWIDY